MTSQPRPPGNAYSYYNAPPPSYSEAVGGPTLTPPPPGFKQPPVGGAQQIGSLPVASVAQVGPEPMSLVCPNCHMTVETTTRTEPGLIAWISGVLIFLFGFWGGCCLIPCCIDSCMDVHHSCPNCKAYLGSFQR